MTIGTESLKFSLGGRTKNCQDNAHIAIKKQVPGPGSYMPKTEINEKGIYHVSTI